LMAETNLDEDAATGALDAAGGDVRIALVMTRSKLDFRAAQEALKRANWVVERAVKESTSGSPASHSD
jgi:N-acetylmuramic acid 6-phosphate (MurNAc-6-P) etherase